MLRLSARKILNYTTQQLWDMLDGEFAVTFDDGYELATNFKEVLYSSYTWDYIRRYPQAPLLTEHHVRSVLNGKRLGSSTHLNLIGRVFSTTYDAVSASMTEDEKVKLRDEMAEMAYRITNCMYNDLTVRCEEYVVSVDILDFLEAFHHPMIQEGLKTLQPTEQGIRHIYDVGDKALRDQKLLGNNSLAKLFRSGLVKGSQVMQCLTVRGYATDVDSVKFRYPILRNFFEGMGTFYNSATESRSAAKSLVFSKEPLQQAEYFSRRLQLVGMSVENLHQTDCGSSQYLKWKVKPKTYAADGKVDYEGDLPHLLGKHYLDERDNRLKIVTAKDTWMEGRDVYLRSIGHCFHPDPNGVCAVCFGQLSEAVPANSNIGHMCTTYMTQQTSQTVLSVKHMDGSAELDAIELDMEQRKYLKPSDDQTSYLLADNMRDVDVKLKILGAYAPHLNDIHQTKDVYKLSPGRISAIRDVWVYATENSVITPICIPTRLDERRVACMTYQLLAYLKKYGWDVSADNVITIDLKHWDADEPLFSLPSKSSNMSDHSKMISEIIESSVRKAQHRAQLNPDTVLVEFFDHVNQKLNVNLAILEIIFQSAKIVSSKGHDYSLPKPWTSQEMGVARQIMDNRSYSARMAYERHQEVITQPGGFIRTNRTESPFDAILMPREVLESGTRQR